MMKLSPQYIAGFFDGEGCLNMARCRKYIFPRVLIVNTDRQILEILQKQFGGRIFSVVHRRKNWKPSWQWELKQMPAVDFLTKIEPWLVIKREQAWAAIAWAEVRPHSRWERTHDALEAVDLIVNHVKWLNRKGPTQGESPIAAVMREVRTGQSEMFV
jgi:hypothetical protein